MSKKWMILFVIASSGLLLAGAALAADGPSIPSWILCSGGGSATVGNRTMDYTVGQWIAGGQTSGDTQLGSGFWFGRGCCSPSVYKLFLPLLRKG
jgi:hypothetical protein